MTKYEVEITNQAEVEAAQAYLWIRTRSETGATRWWNGLVDAILSLESFPERCPLAPESDALEEDIRQLLYGRRPNRYRILYVIEGRTVTVLHIRHGARRILEP